MDPVAVYVHTPFCPSKCGYCDFNSYAMTGEIVERTVAATVLEIQRSPHRGRPAKTIFFGGGTPTYLPIEGLLRIFQAACEAHPPLADCEITSEANPGTVDASKFRMMREAGFNRISLGAQSFLDEDLLRLDRIHKSGDIERAVAAAREAGICNINIDLMFALPGQSKMAWRNNLNRAFDLETDHLSLYCLTIEENTKFYKLFLKGMLNQPDDVAQAEMYDMACDTANERGFQQYEISNFSKPGLECRHNLCYWNSEEYAAYGPGAVEQIGDRRWTHLKHPKLYCEAVEQNANLSCESEELGPSEIRAENIMLGLRLNRGVAVSELPQDSVTRLKTKGWLEQENGSIRLTREGRHYCNQAIIELI